VLVLDCCHSGAFGKGLAPKSAPTVDVEHRFEGRGRVTLSASTELEYAFEERDPGALDVNELGAAAPGSLFTRSVVEGLRSGDADLDQDGRISVDDLYDYVCRRVRERTASQTPGMAGDVRGAIMLARSVRRAELPPELARAVASNLAGIRAGAVSELKALMDAGGPDAPGARAALERLVEDDSRAVATAAAVALGRSPPPGKPLPPAPKPAPRRPPWRLVAAAAGVLLAAAVAVIIATSGGSSPHARQPGATTATHRSVAAYDFDDDGRQDVVLGVADAEKTGAAARTGVVLDRGADGDAQLVRGDVPPAAEDRFGTAVASGDFDDNGRADLAVSAPGHKSITVVYGVHQRVETILAGDLDEPPGVDLFGYTLVARDFNKDGYADLAVGTPGSPAQRAAFKQGSVQILWGSKAGLTVKDARALGASAKGSFGMALAAGDIDRDGNVDLVEGTPDEDVKAPGDIRFCRGAADGPRECDTVITSSDYATTSLAVADFDKDGFDDVAQGDTGIEQHAGLVRVWPGTGTGLAGQPSAVIQQGSDGVPGDRHDGDEFGHDVVAGDVTGDHRPDLIVAARGDEGGSGTLTLVPSGPKGLSPPRATAIPYDVPRGGQLGATLTLLDVDHDGKLDLFAGVKGAPSLDEALVEFPGRSDGLGPGKPVTGLAKLAAAVSTSPLRLGR
jgi:hypothetical protein